MLNYVASMDDLKNMYLREKKRNPNDFNFVSTMFSEIKENYKKEAMARGKDPNMAWPTL